MDSQHICTEAEVRHSGKTPHYRRLAEQKFWSCDEGLVIDDTADSAVAPAASPMAHRARQRNSPHLQLPEHPDEQVTKLQPT
jgi:hypothetical protein